jgi:MoxR-like ATPase
MLAAFADRFLVRIFVEPLADEMLETLLDEGWRSPTQSSPVASVQILDEVALRAQRMDLSGVRTAIAGAVRALRKSGILLTDRRIVRIQRLVAAAAALRGAEQPETQDLWPTIYAIPTAEQQTLGRDVLRDILDSAANPTLPQAAELASGSSSSRALRLCGAIEALIKDEHVEGFARRAEAILREIAAGFDEAHKPEALRDAELRLVARLPQ